MARRRHVNRVDILELQPVSPGGPPLVQVYTEECKRVCTCRGCVQPILANERRFVIESWHHTRSRRERAFFHVGCIAALAEETQKSHNRSCVQCGTEVFRKPGSDYSNQKLIDYVTVRLSKHRGYSYLCIDCANTSSHYVQCGVCHTYVVPGGTTWTVDPHPIMRVCSDCVDRWKLGDWADQAMRTRRDVLREAREQRAFEKLQRQLEES